MSDTENVSLESTESNAKTSANESCVAMKVNAVKVRNDRRLASLKKLRNALVCRLADDYISFGKRTSYHLAQTHAAWIHRQTLEICLKGLRRTVPWYWEVHDLFVSSIIMVAGFDSDYLLVIEFINEDDPNVKKAMTLYSYKNRELIENVPADFDDFCAKLVEICKETASSQPQPNKPLPMVALFNYSPPNYEVLNLIENDIDVKSTLISHLQKLGIIKDEKLCKVQAFDPYKIFPNCEFRQRHALYRETVANLEKQLDNFSVTEAEHTKLCDIIEKTVAFDDDFRKIVKQFATKCLPEIRE